MLSEEIIRAEILILQNDDAARQMYQLLTTRYGGERVEGHLGPLTEGGTPAPPKPPEKPPFVPPFIPAWYAGVKSIDPWNGLARPANDYLFATPETAQAIAERFGGVSSAPKWIQSFTAPTYEIAFKVGDKTVHMNAGVLAKYFEQLKSDVDLANADRAVTDQIAHEAERI